MRKYLVFLFPLLFLLSLAQAPSLYRDYCFVLQNGTPCFNGTTGNVTITGASIDWSDVLNAPGVGSTFDLNITSDGASEIQITDDEILDFVSAGTVTVTTSGNAVTVSGSAHTVDTWQNYQWSFLTDTNIQRIVLNNTILDFVGGSGITTSDDGFGNITIVVDESTVDHDSLSGAGTTDTDAEVAAAVQNSTIARGGYDDFNCTSTDQLTDFSVITNSSGVFVDGSCTAQGSGSSANVSSSTTSTDNAVVRWDGSTGLTVQNSGVTVGDTGSLAGVGNITTGSSFFIGQSNAGLGGTDAIAIGTNAQASETNTIAIGEDANASNAIRHIAIGFQAEASTTSSGAIAIGDRAIANGTNTATIAIGVAPIAEGNAAIAIGSASTARHTQTVAIGNSADATGAYSSAFGLNALASGQSSTALGEGSSATSSGTVAISDATSVGSNSIAIGDGSSTAQAFQIAIGSSAVAGGTGQDSIAIGRIANSAGADSVAISDNANATGAQAIAIGLNTDATGAQSVAIAELAQATGTDSMALGFGANAAHTEAIALGKNALTTANNQLMIGNNTDFLHTFVYGYVNVSSGYDVCISGGNCLSTLTYTNGTGINLTNGAFSILLDYQGQTSITTLGTIGTGTWQATQVEDTYVSDTLTVGNDGTVDADSLGCDVGDDNLISEDCIGDVLDTTEIEDVFVLNTGDQMTGGLSFSTAAANITLANGGATGSVADNSTCTIIYSPNGASRIEVCN